MKTVKNSKIVISVIFILFFMTILNAADEAKPAASNLKTKVVYTFKTEAEMNQFVKIIQSKQAVLARMSILQDYLLQEKANLDQINGQLMLKFQIDPNKNYNLDPKTKQLIELISTSSSGK